MCKNLIPFVFLFVLAELPAQEHPGKAAVDSLTYQLYAGAKWEKLILIGKESLKNNIEFKTLDQRIGYAFFVSGNYYESIRYYEMALKFDPNDVNTNLYLYYDYLYTGNNSLANYYGSKLPSETKKSLNILAFRPIEAIDAEYNYKTGFLNLRSAPRYYRLGINSRLGSNWTLYQTFSEYSQKISNDNSIQNTIQSEYFVLLSGTLNRHLNLMGGYHLVRTNLDGSLYYGSIITGKIGFNTGRLNIGLGGATYVSPFNYDNQVKAEVGYILTLQPVVYLNSAFILQNDSSVKRLIFQQNGGVLLFKTFWIEGNITLGTLHNFVDQNGLYVYNSIDPTVFRTGASLFWYAGKHLTFYTNYTFDQKYMTEYGNYYYQHSFTGGIIWKL